MSIDEGVDPTPYLDISGAVSTDGVYTNTGVISYESGNETMYNCVSNRPEGSEGSEESVVYIWHVFNLRGLNQTTWDYMYEMIYTKLLSDPSRVVGWRLKLDTNSTDIVYHFVYRGSMVLYDKIFNDIPSA
jgi:hypothetical protein